MPGSAGFPGGSTGSGGFPGGFDNGTGGIAGNGGQGGTRQGANNGTDGTGTSGNGRNTASGNGTFGNGGDGSGTVDGNGIPGGTATAGNTGTGEGTGGAAGGIPGGYEDDPFAGLGVPGNGGMTVAERRAALDARLEASYAVFDGMILEERDQVREAANAAGSGVMATGAGQGNGQGDGDGDGSGGGVERGTYGGSPAIIVASGPTGEGTPGALPTGSNNNNTAAFPIPADIPSGNDDDVVARQLREAAMYEPDPELREKLWDEYRKYTGLSQ